VVDLHLVTYGGPDVGMLCAAGKVKHLTFAFVSLDSIPLEPHFRKARESGSIACTEMDEGMVLLGLQAAAWRVPFLPSRIGLGSDLFRVNPELRTVRSPYPSRDGVADEELTAVPAIHLDAALCHLNLGDDRGNAAFLGPDLYFDDLMLEAAEQAFVSVERIVPTEDLAAEAGDVTRLRISRLFVDGVVHARRGAHPTSCDPDYPRDEAFQREYALTAREPAAWDAFRAEWLSFVDEAAYRERIESR
jgi:glutaconate CoA-transferase subunit A